MSQQKPLTSRQKVANHLLDLGYKLHEDDFNITQGGSYKKFQDILECWNITCADPSNMEVLISSSHTLTQCANGLVVIPNTDTTCLYGDLIAQPSHPKKERMGNLDKLLRATQSKQ